MPQYRSFFTQTKTQIKPKPLGRVLHEAQLVSVPQIELALQDQVSYSSLRLGEILAVRGWVKQETADFFAQEWWEHLKRKTRQPLGYYLQRSALIEEKHIEVILEEQRHTGIRFGSVAVLQGLLKSETLDFFLTYLFPSQVGTSSLVGKYRINRRKYQQSSKRSLILDNFKHKTNLQFPQALLLEVDSV